MFLNQLFEEFGIPVLPFPSPPIKKFEIIILSYRCFVLVTMRGGSLRVEEFEIFLEKRGSDKNSFMLHKKQKSRKYRKDIPSLLFLIFFSFFCWYSILTSGHLFASGISRGDRVSSLSVQFSCPEKGIVLSLTTNLLFFYETRILFWC